MTDDFDSVALPHLDAVFGFALSLTHDRSWADDLVQGTFLSAFRRFETFEPGTNCKAWLFRICKNRFIDDFREKRRRPQHQEIDKVEPPSVDPANEVQAWEQFGGETEENFNELFGDEVNRFLAELPEEFRRALVLCDVDGLSYHEIGELMDTPIGTVRSRISRARSFLRERLEVYANENGYLRQNGADASTNGTGGASDTSENRIVGGLTPQDCARQDCE